ncbi:hypothetical protein E2320_022783 [Naja naja]|nr:hypothetical protein E2320_022783 [Naja naja]
MATASSSSPSGQVGRAASPAQPDPAWKPHRRGEGLQLKNFDFSGVTKLDRSTASRLEAMNIKRRSSGRNGTLLMGQPPSQGINL